MPVLLVGFLLGSGVLTGPAPVKTLGYGTQPESGQVEPSPTGWIQKVLGADGDVTSGPLNVLVLGVDTRPPDSKEKQVTGTRTDTIMLVQVVPGTGAVKLLSIPRDLLVEVEPGVKDRINAAYNYGGIDQTLDAVQNYAHIPIDYYAIVDFQGFEDMIDAMGGVRVDVGDVEFPEKWQVGDGVQRLEGREALFYARYRDTPEADLGRMERQRELVAALRSQALGWDTVKKLPELMMVVDANVKTDLGFDDSLALGRVLIHQGPRARMTSEQLQGTPETLPNGDEVLVPDEAANKPILEEFRR